MSNNLSFEEKYGHKVAANTRLVVFSTGCVAVGVQFGWAAGLATFCLLPYILRQINKQKKGA